MTEPVEKSFDLFWGILKKPLSKIPIMFLIFIGAEIYIYSKFTRKLTIFIEVLAFIGFVCILLYEYDFLQFPFKISKKKGILVNIDCENKEEYDDIKGKFYVDMKKELYKYNEDIKVLSLAYGYTHLLKYVEFKKIVNTFKYDLGIVLKESKSEKKYKMICDIVGVNKKVDEIVNSWKDSFKFKEKFEIDEKIEVLDDSKESILLFSKFFLSYIFFMDDDYIKAVHYIEDLKIILDNNQNLKEKYLNLYLSVNKIFFVLYFHLSIEALDEYYTSYKFEDIDKSEKYILKLKDSIFCNLLCERVFMIIAFVKYRDNGYGLNVYSKYRSIKGKEKNNLLADDLFNYAFLSTYNGISEKKIISYYFRAFKKLSNDLNEKKEYIEVIIKFIENVLTLKEIEEKRYYLVLALLNYEIKENTLGNKNLKKYLELNNGKYSIETKIVLLDRYKVEIGKLKEEE